MLKLQRMPETRVEAEEQDLNGKCVLVSGGTSGIGRATAQLLVSRGARVMIFGRHKQKLDEALREIGASGEGHGIAADQARAQDVAKVFREVDRRLGRLDVLINNAAVSDGDIEQKDSDAVRYAVETNFLGYVYCCREAVSRMKASGGHIVNVGSMSADVLEPSTGVYAATKAAIEAFSVTLRKKINEQNIKVSLIEPGAVATSLGGGSAREKRARKDPMQIIEPRDIAECIAFVLTRPRRVDVVTLEVRPHRQLI